MKRLNEIALNEKLSSQNTSIDGLSNCFEVPADFLATRTKLKTLIASYDCKNLELDGFEKLLENDIKKFRETTKEIIDKEEAIINIMKDEIMSTIEENIKLKEQSKGRADLDNYIDSLNRENETLRGEITRWRDQVNSLLQGPTRCARTRKLAAKLKALKIEFNSLQNQLIAGQAAFLNEKEFLLMQLKVQRDVHEAQLEKVKKSSNETLLAEQDQHRKILQNFNALMRQADQDKLDKQNLENEVEKLNKDLKKNRQNSSDLQKLRQTNSSLDREVSRLKDQLKSKSRRDQREREESRRNRSPSRSGESSSYSQKIAFYEQLITDLKIEINRIQSEQKILKDSNENLQQSKDESELLIETLKSQFVAQLNHLKNGHQAQAKQLEKLKEEKVEMAAQIQELQEKLNKLTPKEQVEESNLNGNCNDEGNSPSSVPVTIKT